MSGELEWTRVGYTDCLVTLELDQSDGTLKIELHPAVAFAIGQALQTAAMKSWQPVYAVPEIEIVNKRGMP